MSRIICISREYGSGGHEVAEKTAALLHIHCLDKQLIEKVISSSGLPRELLREAEEKLTNPFLTAPLAYRMQRKQREFPDMDRRKLESYVRQMDKQRKAYYEYHTGKDWGLHYNYDVCLNAASMGTDRIARLIAESFGKITQEDDGK